jgi:hypothetical protein
MGRPLRVLAVLLVLAIALGAAGCQKSDPSSNPWKACPAGMHRIRDVIQSPLHQWVCVK